MSILPSGHDKRFKRQVLFLFKEKQPQKAVLIHYLGDESIAVNVHMVIVKVTMIKCFIAPVRLI